MDHTWGIVASDVLMGREMTPPSHFTSSHIRMAMPITGGSVARVMPRNHSPPRPAGLGAGDPLSLAATEAAGIISAGSGVCALAGGTATAATGLVAGAKALS